MAGSGGGAARGDRLSGYVERMKQARVRDEEAGIDELLARTRRVAVLGIKTEEQRDAPAFYVARYLSEVGFEVVPVPVYYPHVTEILGRPVFRRLVDVPGDIDLVDVFRRPEHLDGHVDDILAKKPLAVWLQLGIRHDPIAARLVRAGIDVVQDRCTMVEHRRWARSGASKGARIG
jgi:predicted CoA-binding protein